MNDEASKYVVVLVTVPPGESEELARTLVEQGLAACANMVSRIRSIYRWKGKICDDEESLLMLKTRADKFQALRSKILELHSYEVPEIIALPLTDGHRPYLDWIDDSLV
ncbi:MAG: divalent-cation tolerance protein CutA [Pseudomonadota bacterium]